MSLPLAARFARPDRACEPAQNLPPTCRRSLAARHLTAPRISTRSAVPARHGIRRHLPEVRPAYVDWLVDAKVIEPGPRTCDILLGRKLDDCSALINKKQARQGYRPLRGARSGAVLRTRRLRRHRTVGSSGSARGPRPWLGSSKLAPASWTSSLSCTVFAAFELPCPPGDFASAPGCPDVLHCQCTGRRSVVAGVVGVIARTVGAALGSPFTPPASSYLRVARKPSSGPAALGDPARPSTRSAGTGSARQRAAMVDDRAMNLLALLRIARVVRSVRGTERQRATR